LGVGRRADNSAPFKLKCCEEFNDGIRTAVTKQFRLRNKDMDMVMRFGTWNVHTVLQAGNMNMIAEEVENIRWT